MKDTKVQNSQTKKSCSSCGAEFNYLPGSDSIRCNHCGFSEEIDFSSDKVVELDLDPYLEKLGTKQHTRELSLIQCKSCGANQHIEENYKSLRCGYCSDVLMVEDMKSEEWILPGAIVPFKLTNSETRNIFAKWINDLWFAPNALKKALLDVQATKGVYLPYWTFDAQLEADYTGKRGEYYYETVSYTTLVDGESVVKNRQEQRTNWYFTSGQIDSFADDTLVEATCDSLNKIPSKVATWNLDALVPFKDDFLAGFITEKYTVPLKDGHLESIKKVEEFARTLIRRDIGGDTQSITSMDMRLSEETFKHILLPVYISSFKYNAKTYSFYVNGQNGMIHGTRPYSFWKIFFLVLGIIVFAGVLILIFNKN